MMTSKAYLSLLIPTDIATYGEEAKNILKELSSLPLGINQIEIKRGLTTSSTAIFVSFTTQELFQSDEALYYGLNALLNSLIMANRKLLRNPKGQYNQGRICNREKSLTFSKKDFRKPYPKFLYYEGIKSAS